MNYKVRVTFTEDLLASSPADPDVYSQFIASRQRKEDESNGDEVDTLKTAEREKNGWSVFHSDDNGIFLFDYKVRGFVKEAAAAVTGKSKLTAYKSKIDRWFFVTPRKIYFENTAGRILKPEGVLERPVRAMTAQGPRVTVKRSDIVKAGTNIEFSVLVLPLGDKEIDEPMIRSWFDYGQFCGMGEFRSGSYGRFEYSMSKV